MNAMGIAELGPITIYTGSRQQFRTVVFIVRWRLFSNP
jgi:hypothetical protein